MSNGRQRRAAARKRGLLQDTDMMGNPILSQNFAGMNTNDGADQTSRLLNTQAGFSPNDLTSLVSDDDNDLDEVSFTTTDGAKVSMKNQRGKAEDGGAVKPKINTLGKSYGGGSTFTGYPTPEPELPAKQPSAITSFIGEDLSLQDEQLEYQANGGRNTHFDDSDADLPFIGGEDTKYFGGHSFLNEPTLDNTGGSLQNPEPEWDPVMPQNAFDELDGYAMGNNPALPENADMVAAQMNRNQGFEGAWDDVIASDAQTNAQDINNIGTSYSGGSLQTPHDALGFPDEADKARAQAEYDQRLVEEDMAAQMRGTRGVNFSGGGLQGTHDALGFPDEADKARAEAEYAQRLADEDMARGNSGDTDQFGNVVEDGDEQLLREELEADRLNELDFAEADSMVKGDIAVAAKGNPQVEAVGNEAKAKVDEVASKVESGELTVESAMEYAKGLFGDLGDLLGVDAKDVTRALVRYAGSRLAGFNGGSSAKFAYKGFETDNSGSTLGKNATANQRNLVAYNKEVSSIAAKEAAGTMTPEEAKQAKSVANQIYKVDKPQKMGRPLNMKGINAQGGEEVTAARRNQNNSYDLWMGDAWVPMEESGLSEMQITGRGAEQANEQGFKDPRNEKGIDNATYVSSTGVPTFKFKTGDERKAYQLAKRSVDSFPVIQTMLADPANVEKLTSALGGLQQYAAGNANAKVTAAAINTALGDALPQKFKSATSAWLQALLRADTGAAFSETEITNYIATNIPQVGDTDETVQFKLAQMKSTTETMAANATQGSKYLLGRMDGSIEAPDSVKKMHSMAGPKTTTKRSAELQSALDLY